MIEQPRSRLVRCRGAVAAEARLLAEVAAHRPRSARELGGPPVRVIVPSGSLRVHVARRIVRELGAVSGVLVQTLHGVAEEVLDRTGRSALRGDAAFAVLARRLAGEEAALRGVLDELAEGYDATLPVVRDILDAGFDAGHEEGVGERLDELSGAVGRARVERARALFRVAGALLGRLRELRAWPVSQAPRLAAEELQGGGDELLPARMVLVHGFADLTGVAADLLSAVLRQGRGLLLVNRPPDPLRPDEDDLGSTFLDRLESGFSGLDVEEGPRPSARPRVVMAAAVDAEGEARWVAEQVMALLAEGVEAEDVAVVARRMEQAGPVLRRQLYRLGIPFSAVGATVPGGAARRRLGRLADLLVRGGDAGIDLWAEAHGGSGPSLRARLALRVLGALRLADVAAVDVAALDPRDLRLPVDLRDEDERQEDVGPHVDPAELSRVGAGARELVGMLDGWPRRGSGIEHARRAVATFGLLGWGGTSDEAAALRRCVLEVAAELPPGLELDRLEYLRVLGGRLGDATRLPQGGQGGGVQLLDAMEARGRTCGHLFLVDLERGRFPRLATEDALLPDAVRARLAADVLPQMPVKARSAAEERYLFAQLLSSAPAVSLSWHESSGQGPMAPSPFVEALRSSVTGDGMVEVGSWPWSRSAVPGSWVPAVRTAYEHALAAGAGGERAELAPRLEMAVEEGRARVEESAWTVTPAEQAASRMQVLAAAEGTPAPGRGGPWLGLVGDAWIGREQGSAVTALEATARCPLRAFITLRLGLMPLPDPQLELPVLGPLLVGQVVHGVLELVVGEGLRGAPVDLDGARRVEGTTVSWPTSERLGEMLLEVASRVATRQGLGALGVAPLLAARARPVLEVERRLEWPDGRRRGVVAAELPGALEVDGWSLRFRADRVDREDDCLLIVDYKVGRPLSELKTAEKRRRDLLDGIRKGWVLQGPAYAVAAGGASAGRYVYLRADDRIDDAVRAMDVPAADPDIEPCFRQAVQLVVESRRRGVAFARVEDAGKSHSNPAHCRTCPVAEACRRDDSSFRRGLVEWMESTSNEGDPPPFRAARDLWWLGVDPAGEETA